MAFNYANASNEWHDTGTTSPITNAQPVSMACWFKPTTGLAVNTTVISTGVAGTATHRVGILFADNSGDVLVGQVPDATAHNFNIGSTLSNGVWAHIGIISASATDHRLYLNGALDATSSTSKSPSNPDSFYIGNNPSDGANSINGDVCEVGVWDADIGLAGMQKLAGVSGNKIHSPELVSKTNLQFYARMRDTITDRFGLGITTNGTPTTTAHKQNIFYGRHKMALRSVA